MSKLESWWLKRNILVYFFFNISIRKLISKKHSLSPCIGKIIQIFLYGLIVITLLIMIIINYEVNSNSNFPNDQDKNLGTILDFCMHIFISPLNQSINKSYLFSPQNIFLFHLYFTTLLTTTLVQTTTILTWIIAIVSLSLPLSPLTPIVSIVIVWSYHDINQIRSPLWLPPQS